MRDVRNPIARVEDAGGARAGRRDVAARRGAAAASATTRRRRALEVFVHRVGVGLRRRRAPLALERLRRAPRHPLVGRDDAEEFAVANDGHAGDRAGGAVINGAKRCAVGRRPHDVPERHVGTHEVWREHVRARHEVAPLNFLDRRAAKRPLGARGGVDGHAAGEPLPGRQLAIGHGAAVGCDDFAVGRLERRATGLPLPCRLIDQHLARRRRGPRDLRCHGRRRARSERPLIERRQIGVRHDERHCLERHAQLIGDDLCQRRPDVLTDFDFARVGRDAPTGIDVNPGADIARALSGAEAAAAFLLGGGRHRRDDDEPAAHRGEQTKELAPIDVERLERVARRLGKLVAFGLVRPFDSAQGRQQGISHGALASSRPRGGSRGRSADRCRTGRRCDRGLWRCRLRMDSDADRASPITAMTMPGVQ